jgi:hypothetical protein
MASVSENAGIQPKRRIASSANPLGKGSRLAIVNKNILQSEDKTMDPRRRLDEKYERLRSSKVPFIETYWETVLEEQPLGAPLHREVIVVRIDKSYLKLCSFLLGFALLVIIGVLCA